ncbi:MAG: aminoacyl-tRNA deacylase [Actinomycetaceae bacterium]|nr:aminoacyl-tRNA deacylase [Actinomycetaceae bacterium]
MSHSLAGATPALTYLNARGVLFDELWYRHSDDFLGGYGVEAATRLGASRDEVFKTLMLDVDGEPVAALVPASHRLSQKKVARAMGSKRAEFMEPSKAQQRSGYVVGGISPFGQKHPHRVVLDERALALTSIIVSGGRRGLSIRLKVTDFLQETEAVVADICAR